MLSQPISPVSAPLVEGKAPWLPAVASTLLPDYLLPNMQIAFPSSLGNLAPLSEKCI